jgi:hypothetical protein
VCPGLREQKLTLGVPAGTPEDLAKPLAALLEAEWHGDAKRWLLRRQPEVEQLIAQLRQAREERRHAALRERARSSRLALATAARAIHEPAHQLEGEGPPVRRFVGMHGENLVRFLTSLSPREQERLFTGARFGVANGTGGGSYDKTSALSWPFDRLIPAQQGWIRATLSSSGSRSSPEGSIVQLWHGVPGDIFVSLRLPSGGGPDLSAIHVPSGPALEAVLKEEFHSLTALDEPTRAANRKELQRLDTLRPGTNDVRWEELDYAQAVLRLSEQLKLPVLADYYTHRARLTVNERRLPAARLAERVADAFGCRVSWCDGVLLLRSVKWPLLDEREIPEALLARWEAAVRTPTREPHVLALDELGEAARSLTDLQIGCLDAFESRVDPKVVFLYEAGWLRKERLLLALCGELPAVARTRMTSTGVLLRDLGGAARVRALEFVGTEAPWLLEGAPGAVLLRLVPTPAPEVGAVFALQIRRPDRPDLVPYLRQTELVVVRQKPVK